MTRPKTYVLLGIDAGGTKTECVAASLRDGQCARLVGPASNYQAVGIKNARTVWANLVTRALDNLNAYVSDIAAAGLGIAGLDRPKDEEVIRSAFREVLPGVPLELLNDAYLALRGGTTDGIGVAVVSGTGCNAMGMNAEHARFRVGGLGSEFGDLGSAHDIGIRAMQVAFRSQDDRGSSTVLVSLMKERYGLQRLDDIVDYFIADSPMLGTLDPGMLAPLVFEAATGGDPQAREILRWAGTELALSARAVARHLFGPEQEFPFVMGGSVLQKGTSPHLRDALVAEVHKEFPMADPKVLRAAPVLGALKYALDVARKIRESEWIAQPPRDLDLLLEDALQLSCPTATTVEIP